MTYIITEDCYACCNCIGVCENNAISTGDTINHIDPEKCIGCGTCASVCPADAIVENV